MTTLRYIHACPHTNVSVINYMYILQKLYTNTAPHYLQSKQNGGWQIGGIWHNIIFSVHYQLVNAETQSSSHIVNLTLFLYISFIVTHNIVSVHHDNKYSIKFKQPSTSKELGVPVYYTV